MDSSDLEHIHRYGSTGDLISTVSLLRANNPESSTERYNRRKRERRRNDPDWHEREKEDRRLYYHAMCAADPEYRKRRNEYHRASRAEKALTNPEYRRRENKRARDRYAAVGRKKQYNREAQATWRRNNPEYLRTWRKNNPEYFRTWRKNNPEYFRTRSANYAKTRALLTALRELGIIDGNLDIMAAPDA